MEVLIQAEPLTVGDKFPVAVSCRLAFIEAVPLFSRLPAKGAAHSPL